MEYSTSYTVLMVLWLLVHTAMLQDITRGNVENTDRFQNPNKTTPTRCLLKYCSTRGAYCDSTCCTCNCNYGESFFLGRCVEDHKAATECKYTVGKQFDPVLLPITLNKLRSGVNLFHCSNTAQFDICSAESTECKVIHAQSYYDGKGWKPLWEDTHVKDIVFKSSTPSDKLQLIGRTCHHQRYSGLVLHLGIECKVKNKRTRSCVRLKIEGKYEFGSDPHIRAKCPPTLPPTTTATTTRSTTTTKATTTEATTKTSTTQSTTKMAVTRIKRTSVSDQKPTPKEAISTEAARTSSRSTPANFSRSLATLQVGINETLVNPTSHNVTKLERKTGLALSTSELALTLVCTAMLILLVLLVIVLVRIFRRRRSERVDGADEEKPRKQRTQKSHSTCELISPKSMYEDYIHGRLSLENGTLQCDRTGPTTFHVLPLATTVEESIQRNGEITLIDENDEVMYDTPADCDSGRGTARKLYAVVHKPKKSVVSETDEGYTSVDERSPKATEIRGEKQLQELYDDPGTVLSKGTPPIEKRPVSPQRTEYDIYERQYDQPFAAPVYDVPEQPPTYDEPEEANAPKLKQIKSKSTDSEDISIRI